MKAIRRRLAGLGAAVAVTAALTVSLPTAAQAANGYCNGNVIAQHDANGFSTRLIRSYDGGSLCVNTWNQTGHQAWTMAELYNPSGFPDGGDYQPYYQYASTGWSPLSSGCWRWRGTPNGSGDWTSYWNCF
ncbi:MULTISPECIES: hypothetical protein [unclassified Kitasatospora]|uniref:hypothetical protein n=1 Tax=unclassified Kitasatospora TaxID=2633591 RepID=UPI0024764E65|nr:hypothetical protein [Kitasatospora sp. MAP12-44]